MHAYGGSDFKWAVKQEERMALWTARHNAYFAALAFRPGCRALTTDVCVPISRLAECILETKKDLDASSLPGPIVGHVGDGNFHVLLLVYLDAGAELEEAEAINERLVHRALSMGGTCTGEHGVGMHKLEALVAEHGEAVDLMKTIKRALDPLDIMNPGKTVPL